MSLHTPLGDTIAHWLGVALSLPSAQLFLSPFDRLSEPAQASIGSPDIIT